MYIREDYPQLSTNVKENNRDLEFVANNVRSALIGTNGLSESKSVSIDTSGKTPNKNPLNTKLKKIIIKLQRLLTIRKLLQHVKKRTLTPKEKTLQVDTDFINTNVSLKFLHVMFVLHWRSHYLVEIVSVPNQLHVSGK